MVGSQSGEGRRLAVPPHTTHHAGPQWAVRRNHRALAGNDSCSTVLTTNCTETRARGHLFMTRLNSAPPVGFIAASELMREPHSFLRSGLPLQQAQGTMSSADFCLLTRYVAIPGAAGFVMRC